MTVKVDYGHMTEIQMQQDEVDYMVKTIGEMNGNGLMVEWGSGGSTVKWLETMKDNQRLISIEHNKEWYDKVDGYIDTRDDIKDRFKYYHRPEMHGFQHGYASVQEEHPHGLDNYFFPDADIPQADIFFIDGIGRATIALLTMLVAEKEDPAIFIHDYYGREQWYSWATQFFPRQEKVGYTLVRLYLQ